LNAGEVVWIWLYFCKLPHTGSAGSGVLGSAFVLSAWSGNGDNIFLERFRRSGINRRQWSDMKPHLLQTYFWETCSRV